MKNQPSLTYNAVTEDPLFLEVLQQFSVLLVAPGSGAPEASIKMLKNLTQLNLDDSCLKITKDIPYHACDDADRFKQLKNALYHDSNAIILWTLRGGYGSARLIENLQKLTPPAKKKYFIGFSDNTALHLFLSQHWHWQTIHGSGFAQLLDPKQDPRNFLKIIEIIGGKTTSQTLSHLKPMNQKAKTIQTISGQLTGGNLTLVENSIGTVWQVAADDCILFLEEVGEKGYRIDRSLLHLHQAGILNKVRAIVFGEYLCEFQHNHISLALQRFADNTHIPVFQTHQFGHGETNYPLIYRANAEISPENENTFLLQMYMHL